MRKPESASADRPAPMNRRELYFSTHHQAAHAVAAITLGCGVDYVDIAADGAEFGWNLDDAPTGDVETICAAGFAMERILGRLHEHAWARSQADRALQASIVSGRTGVALDDAALIERFMEGADSSTGILNHQATRNAIDVLAEALSEEYDAGGTRLNGDKVTEIVRHSLN